MSMQTVYEKIEKVLALAGKPLAPHDFADVKGNHEGCNGRQWIGCSESALGRRLRELRELGRVTSKRRDGEAFVEYSLVTREPVMSTHPNQEVW